MKPRTRTEGLIVRELPDELLVYDLERHRAHCLNPTAALVFKHCNGRRSVAQIARILRRELDMDSALRFGCEKLANQKVFVKGRLVKHQDRRNRLSWRIVVEALEDQGVTIPWPPLESAFQKIVVEREKVIMATFLPLNQAFQAGWSILSFPIGPE